MPRLASMRRRRCPLGGERGERGKGEGWKGAGGVKLEKN